MNQEPTPLGPIRLGIMPPLTGLVAIYGPEIYRAAKIACDEVNENGGLLGRTLELVVEDDGSLPQTAVPAAIRLVKEHHCVAIIGNLLSNSRIEVANQVADLYQIPYLNFSFYEGSIDSRYFFHFAALPNQQIDQMIPFVCRKYGPKLFFAGNNYEWPRGSIDAAKLSLQRIGGEVLGEEYLPMGASDREIDFLLRKVAMSGADVFVPYFAGSDQIKLLQRFTEMGLKQRMAVIMGHYDEVMVSHLSAEVREGFYSVNTYFMSLESEENKAYLKRLAQFPGVAGIWPNGNGMLTNFGAGAYVCVKAFAAAVAQAEALDSDALIAALERVHVRGPQGEIAMDAKTHHANAVTYFTRCRADGTFEMIHKFGPIEPLIPLRYLKQKCQQNCQEYQSGCVSQLEHTKAVGQVLTADKILALADMAVLATNEKGIILQANLSACRIFGYGPNELIGRSVNLLVPPNIRCFHEELIQRFVKGTDNELLMSLRKPVLGYRKDGSFFPLEASLAKFNFGAEWLVVVTMHDISVQQNMEKQMTWQANHDSLTGLPNRNLILERLASSLHRGMRGSSNTAVLYIDLDGFKFINDTHGHDAGDFLLREAGKRILEILRPGDTLARISGDEFVLLCEQINQPMLLSSLAERLIHALRQPYYDQQTTLFVTASIGISVGHGSLVGPEDLLRTAHLAMNAVKEKGRDGWQFFNEGLESKARLRIMVMQGLRSAIENNELHTRLQPIVSADTGKILGAEILLRWFPEGGEISPAVFIPIAEVMGSIYQLGAWVFRQGCLAQVQLRDHCQSQGYISINVSTRQLNEERLVRDFAKILQETGADPSKLLLEITETALMDDVEQNLKILARLAELGMRVAVDDFGTGYSSLAQLTRFPVSVLKIDRAFVDGIQNKQESRTLIRAIIGLGRALGLKLIAEGVETQEQLQILRAFGCDLIQGYYFFRPLEPEAFFQAVVADNHKKHLLQKLKEEDSNADSPKFC